MSINDFLNFWMLDLKRGGKMKVARHFKNPQKCLIDLF